MHLHLYQYKISLSLFISILGIILCFLMMAQSSLSEKHFFSTDSTVSVLESGFESLKASLLISSPFFFLAAIFVLFDLELILLFPGVATMMTSNSYSLIWGLTVTLVLLTLSFEWAWYGLKWQI